MSRAKHKTSKLIEPGNSHDRNRLIAQLGEFADGPEWELAFIWRWRSMFIAWRTKPMSEKELSRPPPGVKRPSLTAIQKAHEESARLAQLKLDNEIGEKMRAAMIRGDWQFLDRLAKATKFVAEHFIWKANSISDFAALLAMKGAQFVDPLRATISQEYFFHSGNVVDTAKKSRETFMAYIAKELNVANDHSDRGSFSKAFDRACMALGVHWR